MNRHFILFAIVFAAALSGVAKTFDVDISTGRPAASNEAYYHGETIEFRAVRGRSVVTNVEYSCVYYQTNGMDSVWWHTDGLVFHPTNDVGAASYRFFLEGRDDLGRDWHANGLLRLLPSPGFTPNEIELPVARLDFANIEVANDPWTEAIESNRVEIATVRVGVASNSAAIATNSDAIAEIAGTTSALSDSISTLSTNVYTKAETDAAIAAATPAETDPVWDREKSGYATIQALEEGDIVPDRANKANYANLAGLASNAAELGDRSATVILTQLDDQTAQIATLANTTSALNDSISTLSTNVYTKAETDAAIAAATPAETDPTVPTWAKSATKPSYTASEVGAATAEDVYRIVAGTNVLLIVTNYNSAVHAPLMSLQHLDPDTGEYVVYWNESRRHGITLTNAMEHADAAVAAERERADAAYAPRAWSHTTSGLGAEAPAGVTWISTPETVIAGGYEYEKVVTSAGAVWVLASNGLTAGATTNGYFRIEASDGTELFSIEKTDSYLVGVPADGITRSGNTVTIPLNVVAPSHPYIRAATNLVNAVWTKEDENGFACDFASVSWSGSSGAYVATVTCAEPQAFFYFEFLHEGTSKIRNSAATEMTGGIYFNGTTYMPTVNGNKLEFVAQ